MKKISTIILLVVLQITVYAQINPNTLLPEVLPKNPQAFQFSQYGDIPVGKYTGRPNVTIPLYTIPAKGLSIPLSLSYISNGLKVVEEAGWTGLGWVLEGEGTIIQNVQGSDDYGFYKYRQHPDLDCMLQFQTGLNPEVFWLNKTPIYLEENSNLAYIGFRNCGFTDQFANGIFDTTPDKYTFSFLGYTGEFVLDWKTGKFECITNKNIKIISSDENSYTLPQSYVIIVPEGHRFMFSLKEETQAIAHYCTTETNPLSSTVDVTNSYEKSSRVYKLTQIVTNEGDIVTFDYMLTSVSKNLPVISTTFTDYQQLVPSNQLGFPLTDGEVITRLATQQPYSYLSAINFTGGSVKFITSTRTDIKEARKLDKIEIRSTGGGYVKNFTFNYDYFTSSVSTTNWDSYLNFNSYSSGKTNLELTQRLKLISVGEDGINPYKFSYNTQLLPRKTSYGVDFWGYYNGALNNKSLMPNIYSFNLEQNNLRYAKYQDNNKSPSIACKAGILEKITYPTGGYTTFDWEMNVFDNVGIPDFTYDAVKRISLSTTGINLAQSVYLEADYTLFTGGASLSTRGCTDPQAYANCYIKIQIFKPELMAYLQTLGGLNSYGLNGVMGMKGFTDGTNSLYNTYIKEVIYLRKNYNDPIEQFLSGLSYNFPKGIIVFEVRGGCGTYDGINNSSQANLNLTYKAITPLPQISIGGGLRVSSITSFSNGGQISSKKKYQYDGGKLMSPPILLSKRSYQYLWPQYQSGGGHTENGFLGDKCVLSSGSIVSPETALGSFVGYDKVTETQIANDDQNVSNGSVEEYYYNVPASSTTIGDGAYTNLAIPAPAKFPRNGSLKNKNLKNKAGQDILKEAYTYHEIINDINWNMKVAEQGNYKISYGSSVYYKPNYLICIYPIFQKECLLKSITTEEIFPNSTTIKKVEEKFYDNYNQLSKNILTYTGGAVDEINYLYPYSYGSGDSNYSILQLMTQNNSISNVIEQKTFRNNELLGSQRYDFYRRLNSNGYQYPDVFHKKSVKTFKGNQTVGKQINFTRFDSKGNVLELEFEGKYTSYLYGYSLTVPIAVIDNIQYATIPSDLISSLQSKTDTGTESEVLNALTLLRTSVVLQNAQMTSYAYKPLVGVTAVIQPNGAKTTYQFDDNGRLEFIKDDKGNIESEFKYNYKLNP
ncbi:hypothetical protein AMR72_17565 [Flavobacterium psychrophilum]|nr:hypothetical protein AMR72_17565 [Flavobacterium psychrophilum]AOE54152.1 hypothetical protein ALW18_17550 [Flavobacterium psychrophilum]